MRRYRLIVSLIILGLATGLLASCSSNSASGEAASANKTIPVAVANNSKPISYIDESGKLTGYEVEVLRKIDRKLPNVKFKIESVSQEAEEVGIDTGKYSLVAQGFFKTPERAKKYLFPNQASGVSLMKIFTVAGKGKRFRSLADLRGQKIAPVPPNGGVYNLLVTYNKQHPQQKLTFKTAENVPIANRFKEINNGKYDALIWPSSNVDVKTIEKSLHIKIEQSQPVQVNPTYFLIAKGKTKLKDQISTALKKLKRSGELQTLSKKYFNENIFKYAK
jgi:L-cystine transport system substrate-binding protein